MKCPYCNFENTKNKNVCENCGSDLVPPTEFQDTDIRQSLKSGNSKARKRRWRPQGKLIKWIWRLIQGIFNFILYLVVIIICAAAILGVLFWQCRVNVPNPPGWKFLPNIIVNYWEWLDDWQMKRCPDLTPDNYFFGEEPIPTFDEEGELVIDGGCAIGTITFTPPGAPAGSSLDISLDDFPPEETVQACWYFPSTKLENCIDIEIDEDGHADTVYFSEGGYPKGNYSMEVESSCEKVVQEFTIE